MIVVSTVAALPQENRAGGKPTRPQKERSWDLNPVLVVFPR